MSFLHIEQKKSCKCIVKRLDLKIEQNRELISVFCFEV